jgi:type IX secretion system PorP/SprF family membrane protein
MLLISFRMGGQEIDHGPGYQMMMINNPSLAGSDGTGSMRLSYLNYFPGNGYNLHSVYFSYDSYFPALHGGAAIYLADDYLGGIINDFRGGLSYSYFLKAGKDLFINAGLSASVYHRGYNFSGAVLPDQIDPLAGAVIPSAEALASPGRTVPDIGAGFLFMTGKFSGGFSVNHLAEPDISSSAAYSEKLQREVLVHLTGDFDLNKSLEMKIQPLVFMNLQGDYFIAGAGTAFGFKSFSVNIVFFGDNGKNLNIQTGFSFTAGKVTFFYNYRLNVISGNNLLPLSLQHQTGLAFSLNGVEKRNAIKTINFPKL